MNQLNHLINDFPKLNIQTFERIKTMYHNTNPNFFIPKGPKYFSWFTYLENRPICIFLHYENNEIQTIHHYYVAFKDILSLGTILYGTMIDKKFICENIYYYQGNQVILEYLEKIKLMKEVLSHINCSEYLGSISFFLPKMSKGRSILEASNLPYMVHGILTLNSYPKYYTLTQNLCYFNVKKRAESEDVYELYGLNDKNEAIFHSTALINDFKTSHFMKKLFYKRKKNYKNIEFSDSEDEEENVGDFFIGCIYIQEFKKWKPYIFKNNRADNIRHIQNVEKKIFG